ncbi:MAG: adenosylcobalamin-dependent ribonucleoside-diphosphate reductase [Candidatus Omnitrophota bacterium]|nr:MAG: adenosylcobalamin-dependent ribonucleoside-diphosphate reductase [Candidatus Omnitrophota bacterium]RKY43989.1 MAG: adenosylcobalamin-dependent ribonucleoside-diphosphate reductase [Candidatus Omnitrophota bacterium]
MNFSPNAYQVLKARYLKKDSQGRVCESPSQMFFRVAQAVAKAEKKEKINYFQDKFFQIMSNLEFLPNSPTLMNAGTCFGQLSACFVLPIEDSIESIFEAVKIMGIIHQTGGGTGFSFSRLRPQGDIVASTGGRASGPVSFMKIFDTATSVVIQGGRRRGANMGVLNMEHPDILKFIQAKEKEGEFSNFNLSVAITDNFMRCLKNREDFYLINPRQKKRSKKVKPDFLFHKLSSAAFNSGEPGVVFIDRINRHHPVKGKIEATNPCGEVPLLPYESCNLGSINLSKVVENQRINWEKLKELVELGVRFLDDVIEVNNFPIPQIEKATKVNRKIGLGVMGFADMLIKLEISYDSEAAVSLAKKIMKFIRSESLRASSKLASERGVFPNYKFSLYKKKGVKLRNATLNSIAPTGSISIIAGCSSGIEPLFAISYQRRILGGKNFLEVNPYFLKLAKEKKFYSSSLIEEISFKPSLKKIKDIPLQAKRIFVTAFDISYLRQIQIQQAFQKYTDNAVSKTINLPEKSSINTVKNIYLLAYKLGLKGITIYRYNSRKKQVLSLAEEAPLSVHAEYSGGCLGKICSI